MAEAEQIGIAADADATVSSLRDYDASAPSPTTMGTVYGTAVSAGTAGYVSAMESLNTTVLDIFNELDKKITSECDTVLRVIADMQETDADAARVLAQHYPAASGLGLAAGVAGSKR